MAGTRWVRLDTSYLMNPKIMAVDADAVLLHVASMTWCADQLTDGRIPAGALPTLATMARIRASIVDRAAAQLVAADLWHANGDGWYLHDFVAMNGQATRAEVEAQRTRWAKNKAEWRAARKDR